MDNQSRSRNETAGYSHDNGYYIAAPTVNENDQIAAQDRYTMSESECPNPDPFTVSDLAYLGSSNFPPTAYSPELDLYSETTVFAPSPPRFQPQYHFSGSDPELALEQVQQIGLGCHNSSPWDPVANDPAYLSPSYPPPPSTHRTLLSRATRSQADDFTQPTIYTSSRWDAASSRSEYTNGSTVSSCGACGKSFGDVRQARRHENEVHREDSDPQYVCKCNYQVTRKSNYLRHLGGSCKGKTQTHGVFVCICTEPGADYQAHLAHVKVCGKKKAGRPPNSSRRMRA